MGRPVKTKAILEHSQNYSLGFTVYAQQPRQTTENKKRCGPLTTEEIIAARNHWVIKSQRGISESLTPSFKLVKDEETGILKRYGTIHNYRPTYLEDDVLVEKLIRYVHEQNNHLGIAHTMADLREDWWIPHLRARVKKQIRNCNTCKVYSTKPYGATTTASLPKFRTEVSRPFQHRQTSPVRSSTQSKRQQKGKLYVLVFTWATSRAVHLELTKSQTAKEFKRKLNSFIHYKEDKTTTNSVGQRGDLQSHRHICG